MRTTREVQDAENLAGQQGLDVLVLELRTPDVLDAVLGSAITWGAHGLYVHTDAVLAPLRSRIVAFAEQHRLPAIYATVDYAYAGGLLAYGVSIPDLYRRSATVVDKVLKGAKPADLPVEQPTTFSFIVNQKAAHAMGLTVPDPVLRQATELIQ